MSLPFPSFYDPARIAKPEWVAQGVIPLTRNDLVAEEASIYAVTHNLPQGITGNGIVLVIVDGQVCFVEPGVPLYVRNAEHDTRRLIEFIYHNLDKIDKIILSLDSHLPIQIHTPSYWLDRTTGKIAKPYTVVTEQLYLRKYVPRFNPDFDPSWNDMYIPSLKANGKRDHMLWPGHAVVFTADHALESSLAEAIIFWAVARGINPDVIIKGMNQFTEMFSILEAINPVPGDPDTQLNLAIINDVENYPRVYIAGQARSHCVLDTIASFANYYRSNASHMLPRIHLLEDCMSDVDGSAAGVDFTALANPFYDNFYKMGMQRALSTVDL